MRITIEIDTEKREIALKHNNEAAVSIATDVQNTAEMISFIIYKFPEIFGVFWGNMAKTTGLDESSMKDCAYQFLMSASHGFKHVYGLM